MDAHSEMLLAQYREMLPNLKELEDIALKRIREALDQQGITVTAIDHRIKTEKSLSGKLELKGGKYKTIGDITDLLGLRVITFYADDVDKVAAIVAQAFDIDWTTSVDKRKLHQLDSFGYNSLHYICSLPAGAADPAICSIRFEVQMRTALQHVWSTINHDTGYKSDVQIPREYLRQFGRLAGMLELIDDEFSRLRNSLADYRRRMQSLVASGQLDEVPLSSDTWESYLRTSPFERLNKRIAAVNQAEIFTVSLVPFLKVMRKLEMETLGDVQRFVDANSDDAYLLAVSELAITDIDIITESVGIMNLCYVHALKNGGGKASVLMILNTLNPSDSSTNEFMAQSIVHRAASLPFMQK